MEETIFEFMERTHFVDRLLLALAFAIPVLVAGMLRLFRDSTWVRWQRPRFIIIGLTAPVVWVMWHIYNAVANHYGIDSVAGIFVNAVLMLLAVSALAAFYYLVLLRYAEADGAPIHDTEPSAAETNSADDGT